MKNSVIITSAIRTAVGSLGKTLKNVEKVTISNVIYLYKNRWKLILESPQHLLCPQSFRGMIVGKVDVEEILGSIFNDFCIGK